MIRRIITAFVFAAGFVAGAGQAWSVPILPGDILVTDFTSKSLFKIDPNTGAQTVISSFGSFANPLGVKFDANGNIFVSDLDAFGGGGAIFQIDPDTAAQTVISSGGNFVSPAYFAFDASGDIIIADLDAAGGGGAIIKVSVATGTLGTQTVISDFSNGSLLSDPLGIAIDPTNGNIYTADLANNSVVKINPATGSQTLISSLGFFADPFNLIFDGSGNLLVADRNAFPGSVSGDNGGIIKIDLSNNTQSIYSNNVIDIGPFFVEPQDLVLDVNGDLLVVDRFFGFSGGPGRVIGVSPDGTRSLLSSNAISSGAGGTASFNTPAGIAVAASVQVPEPASVTMFGSGLAILGFLGWSMRRRERVSAGQELVPA